MKVDPCLIMDDIIEKLHLLDYSHKFCPSRGHKPISHTYFAIDQNTEDDELKFQYMIELSYWLMSLGYDDSLR